MTQDLDQWKKRERNVYTPPSISLLSPHPLISSFPAAFTDFRSYPLTDSGHRLGSPPLYPSIHSCLLPPFLHLPPCLEGADAGCLYLRRYSATVSDTVGKQNTESDLLVVVLDVEA